MTDAHTKGLHRGYADNLRVEWNRRGKSGHSSIALLNAKKRPVAVLLGDYAPGECDADMDAAARLFCAAPDLLEALRLARSELGMIAMHKGLTCPASSEVLAGMAERKLSNIDAAIAKATSTEQGERG